MVRTIAKLKKSKLATAFRKSLRDQKSFNKDLEFKKRRAEVRMLSVRDDIKRTFSKKKFLKGGIYLIW